MRVVTVATRTLLVLTVSTTIYSKSGPIVHGRSSSVTQPTKAKTSLTPSYRNASMTDRS
jgi:hypothetical protein